MSEFKRICATGDIKLVRKAIADGHREWNYGLYGACISGNKEIIHLMKINGANNTEFEILGASFGGHLQTFKDLMSKNRYSKITILSIIANVIVCNNLEFLDSILTTYPIYKVNALYCATAINSPLVRQLFTDDIKYDIDYLLFKAGRGGCHEVIQMLCMKGEIKWDIVFMGICMSGDTKLSDYLYTTNIIQNIRITPKTAKYAGYGGNTKIINLTIKCTNGAYINHIIYGLLENGHANKAKVYLDTLIDKSIIDLSIINNILKAAVIKCNIPIVKLLISYFPVNTNIILVYSAKNGNSELFKLALSRGANAYREVINNVIRHNNYHCIQILIDYIGKINLSPYFDYKENPNAVNNALKYGINVKLFEGINGYNELLSLKQLNLLNIQKILNSILQKDIINIIDSYLLIDYQ